MCNLWIILYIKTNINNLLFHQSLQTGPQLHHRGQLQVGRKHPGPRCQGVRNRPRRQGSLPPPPTRRLPRQRGGVPGCGGSRVPLPGNPPRADVIPGGEVRRRVAAGGPQKRGKQVGLRWISHHFGVNITQIYSGLYFNLTHLLLLCVFWLLLLFLYCKLRPWFIFTYTCFF